MNQRHRHFVFAAVLSAALFATGCSSATSGQAAVASAPAGSAGMPTTATGPVDGTTAPDPGSSSSESDSSQGSSSTSSEDTALPSGVAGIPSSDCLAVAGAYAQIELSFLSVLTGGTGNFDASKVLEQLKALEGTVPDELKASLATLTTAAQQASGKSLTEASTILASDSVKAATDSLNTWLTKNCGGG